MADPLLAFRRDHEEIRPRRRALEAALDAAMNRDRAVPPELAVFRGTIAFLQSVAFDHFRREERALLPPLEAKVGRYGSLVNVIAYDHEEGRGEVDKLAAAGAVLGGEEDGQHAPHRRE